MFFPTMVVTIVSGISDSNITELEIPATINGKPITHICDSAFKDCKSITSITISKGVTSIGDSAFENCYALTSVVIPDGVTSIEWPAFTHCKNLASVVIPYGVTTIESSTFSYCTALVSVTIPSSVTSIDSYAFENCDSFKTVYYTGTAEEWATISIANLNGELINATRSYYSATEPIIKGNFWHYIDGIPTPWTDVTPIYSGGLAYTLSADGTYYILSGIGT